MHWVSDGVEEPFQRLGEERERPIGLTALRQRRVRQEAGGALIVVLGIAPDHFEIGDGGLRVVERERGLGTPVERVGE